MASSGSARHPVHSDNGAEFHSRALTGACREYGIKIQQRAALPLRLGSADMLSVSSAQ